MLTLSGDIPAPPGNLVELRPCRTAAFAAFQALLQRDLAVLRKELPIFIVRTIMQPLLLLFVFTYVFPRIGQGIGGTGAAAADFPTMLVSGVVATAWPLTGSQALGQSLTVFVVEDLVHPFDFSADQLLVALVVHHADLILTPGLRRCPAAPIRGQHVITEREIDH